MGFLVSGRNVQWISNANFVFSFIFFWMFSARLCCSRVFPTRLFSSRLLSSRLLSTKLPLILNTITDEPNLSLFVHTKNETDFLPSYFIFYIVYFIFVPQTTQKHCKFYFTWRVFFKRTKLFYDILIYFDANLRR